MVQLQGANYLTTREVADVLKVHPGSVRRWHHDGHSPIAALKLGASILWPEAEVLREAQRRGVLA